MEGSGLSAVMWPVAAFAGSGPRGGRESTSSPGAARLLYPGLFMCRPLRGLKRGMPWGQAARLPTPALHDTCPAWVTAMGLLLTLAASCPCLGEPAGKAGEAQVIVTTAGGLRLAVTMNGVTFEPLCGLAAIGPDGRPDPTIPLEVQTELGAPCVRLTITSSDRRARGLDPGAVVGLGTWRRLDLSRQSEPYGQTGWQKTTYSVQGDFWFTAHWVMEESNGTCWEAPNVANSGEGPFPAALRVVYAPDTAGQYLPIREVLELRFARSLWEAVPFPRQQPSEYAQELAGSVQLDLWSGKADPELIHFLEVMAAVGGGRVRFLTILQNWEAGGWDALLPDSVWLPDYPPNPEVGTVAALRALCEVGKRMGRFGFRTNYRVLRQASLSLQRGLAHFAVGPDGKPLDYLRPADWPTIAGRQEREIHDLFAPNASFTDQLTSGAAPWAWHDYAADGGSRAMSETLRRQRALARLIKEIHHGPLGSESLMDQELLGEYVDSGDWSIMDGHHRLFSPEFKLRRLQHLSMFHGMGLMYRFYEMPPFPQFHAGQTTFGDDAAQLDDYRACEIMYGNGAYVCYGFANWRYWLTECLLVGNLQKHYALQPVRDVRYWHEGEWVSLEELVRRGLVPDIAPWTRQPPSFFGRVRVEYQNGLIVVVNRLPQRLAVPDAPPDGMTLPQYGWVAWKPDGSFIAFSADWPHTAHRVDYLRDDAAQLEFIDPRGAEIRAVTRLTAWECGRQVLWADPEANELVVCGQRMPLNLEAATK